MKIVRKNSVVNTERERNHTFCRLLSRSVVFMLNFSFIFSPLVYTVKTAEARANYNCQGNAQSDQFAYDEVYAQMKVLQARIDNSPTQDHTSETQQMRELQEQLNSIRRCFEQRGAAPRSDGSEFLRQPDVGNTTTAPAAPVPLTQQVAPLVSLKNELETNLNDLRREIRLTQGIGLSKSVTLDMAIPEMEAQIIALEESITEMNVEIGKILQGFGTMNFQCEAVCVEDKAKMNALLLDDRCNHIKQCRDCRSAFISTQSETIDQTGTGRIGVLGTTCHGYGAAKSGKVAFERIADRWRGVSNACFALGFIPLGGGIACAFKLDNAADDSDSMFKDWERSNKDLLARTQVALAEVGQYPTFSADIGRLNRVSFLGMVGTIVSGWIGGFVARARYRDARDIANGLGETAQKVCSFITKYSEESSLVDAKVSSCTVYAGFLLNRPGPRAPTPPQPPISPSPPTPPKPPTPPGTPGAPNSPGTPSTPPGTPGAPNSPGTPLALIDNSSQNSAAIDHCNNMSASACRTMQQVTAPGLAPEDNTSRFNKLTTQLSAIDKNKTAAEKFSGMMDKIEMAGGENLSLGSKMSALAPGISSASVTTFNDLERSLKAHVEKTLGSNGGGNSTSSGGPTSGTSSAAQNAANASYANSQDLNFPGRNPASAGIFIDPNGSGNLGAVNFDGINTDKGISLFAIMNDCTLRKQKSKDVAILTPLLQRNRLAGGSALGPATRSLSSELFNETKLKAPKREKNYSKPATRAEKQKSKKAIRGIR